MNTLQSISYAQKIVDLNQPHDLAQWVAGQNAFAIHAVVDHALKRQAWECLGVLFGSRLCSRFLASHVLRQQVAANNTIAVQHLAATVNPFDGNTVDGRWVESAVLRCVKNNNTTLLKAVLDGSKHTCNPYVEDYEDYATLLLAAAENNNAEAFEYIIDRQPNVLEQTNMYGLLRECIANRSHDVLQMVLPLYNSPEELLELAAEFNNSECMHLLKDYVCEEDFSAGILSYCAQQGDLKILELFGIDENDAKWNASHVYAIIESANLDLFKRVVPHKCAYTLTSSDYASLFNNTDEERIMPFLDWMVTQVDPKLEQSQAITQAINRKKWTVVERLLPVSDLNMVPNHVLADIGACPNVQLVDQMCAVIGNHIKQSVFETAAASNNMIVLQHLIDDVNPKFNRSTALDQASCNDHVEAVTFLLTHSDVTAEGFTVFETLAQKSSVFPQSLLIDAINCVPADQQESFTNWLHTRAHENVKSTIEHALNTIQNQSLHAQLPCASALKKRKM